MRITERVVEQAVILSLDGKFVFEARKEFQRALQQAQEKLPRKILLNMELVTYLDSSGLGLIAIGLEQTKSQNIGFGLVNPSSSVERILELTQLLKLLPVYHTEEEALRLSSPVFAPGT